MRVMFGICWHTSSQSSMVMGQPAAWEIAVRCSMVLVEPPKAMSSAMPFLMECSLMISSAVMFFSTSSITFMPACLAKRMRSEYTAGMVPLPGRAMPKPSERQQMELAVNMPEQLPHVGHAVFSNHLHSSSVMVPAVTWPTASNKVFKSVSLPHLSRPASMGPPDTSTVGRFMRHAASNMPGTILSHEGIRTTPSKAWP